MSTQEYEQFTAELQQIFEINRGLAREFESVHADGPRTVNTAFTQALSGLHEIAEFISGDFDDRLSSVLSKPSTNLLFNKVQTSFHNLGQVVDDVSKALDRIKERDLDLKKSRLDVLNTKVISAQQTNCTQVQDLENQIQTEDETLRTQNGVIKTTRSTCEQLNRKLEEDEEAKEKANLGLSVLIPIWGIAGLINKDWSPGHVVMGADLAQAEQAYQNAITVWRESQLNLQRLQARMQNMEAEHESLLGFMNQISTVERDVGDLGDTLDMLFKAVVQFSKGAGHMLQQMSNLAVQAALVTSDSFFKADYAQGILDICNTAINEPQSALLVKGVCGELAAGYGGQEMPAFIQQGVTSLQKKIKAQMRNSG